MSNNTTALISRRRKEMIEQHIAQTKIQYKKYGLNNDQAVFFCAIQLSIPIMIPYLCSPKQKSLCGWAVFIK